MSDNDRPVNIVRGTYEQLILFLVLNAWTAHLGLPALLAIVIFAKNVKRRHSTFLNLCFAFIIIGITSSLLLYAGRITGPEPSKILCLLQASLIYGMPGFSSTAALMLVLQMFFTIRAAHMGKEYNDADHVSRVWVMLAAPYFAFFATVLATAVIGSMNPSHVSRNRRFFYCSVENLTLTNTITTIAAVVLLCTLVFIVWTMILLYRRWQLSTAWGMDLSFPIRIIAYGVYIIICMSLSLLSVKSPESPAPDLMIASAPTVLILIFGTQGDIISFLCFWRRLKSHRVEENFSVHRVDLQDTIQNSADEKELPPLPQRWDRLRPLRYVDV